MGQTEIAGRCEGLMPKNGEHNVVDFACAESCRLFVCGKSSSFCLTWPICIGNLWPALVYTWIRCLWRINGIDQCKEIKEIEEDKRTKTMNA
jgi:hypothetical protein